MNTCLAIVKKTKQRCSKRVKNGYEYCGIHCDKNGLLKEGFERYCDKTISTYDSSKISIETYDENKIITIQRQYRKFISDKKNKITQILVKIFDELKKRIGINELHSFNTKKGETQKSEKNYRKCIENILNDLKIRYETAGSQQPYDYRIYLNKTTKFMLEIKKTDATTIIFNDTCPSKNIYYIFLICNKTSPCIILCNGDVFDLMDTTLIEFKRKFNELKNEFCGKKLGNLLVYPRPTYSSNIKSIFDMHEQYKTDGDVITIDTLIQ